MKLEKQISSLEKAASIDAVAGMKVHLDAAMVELREARSKSTIPAQKNLNKAITQIARQAGMAVGEHSQALKKSSARTPRKDPVEVKNQILAALPPDKTLGLPGQLIAKEVGISYQTLRVRLGEMQDSGQVVRQGKGNATTWHRA